jgi:death-on-curing protein
MNKILYFDVRYAIKTHDIILNISGGKEGYRDLGLLESMLAHVQNDEYYPLFSDKLTHIVFSIAMGHIFVDANKRSSIALGIFFLVVNGYSNIVGKFIVEMENIVLWVAQERIGKVLLGEIISSLLEYGEIKEELKLKIFELLD